MCLSAVLPNRGWWSKLIFHVGYPILVKPHYKEVFSVIMFTDGPVWRIDGTVKINKYLYGYFWNEKKKMFEKKPVKGVFLVCCGSSGLQSLKIFVLRTHKKLPKKSQKFVAIIPASLYPSEDKQNLRFLLVFPKLIH